MLERLREAEAELARGKAKRAFRILWDEKVSAATRGDVPRLEAIVELAERIARESAGKTATEASLLLTSARSELDYTRQRLAASDPRAPLISPVASGLAERVEEFGRRLQALERELAALRALTGVAKTPPEPTEREPVPAGGPAPPPPSAAPPRAPAPPPPPTIKLPSLPRLTLADLQDPRVLAWAGGVVTLLGIVFLSVLAVERGWIGPELRVVFGALVSAGVYCGALFIKKRYGRMQAALAAAGAGIGGAYATLAAAAAVYEFLSKPQALAAAAFVAAVGVATSLVWEAQMTAALGLVGAMFGPAIVEQDVSLLGSVFVAVLLGATVVLTLLKRWLETMIAGALAAFPLAIALLIDNPPGQDFETALLAVVFSLLYLVAALGHERRRTELRSVPQARVIVPPAFLLAAVGLVLAVAFTVEPASPVSIVALVASIALLYLALAVALQLRSAQAGTLARQPAALLLASVGFVFPTTVFWFEGQAEGYALLTAAAVYLLALPLLRGRGQRDLSSALWAIGLAVAAVGVGELLSGNSLALVWAAQGALLAWVALRAREPRLQLGSLAYLALALGQALVFEAAPRELFVVNDDPAEGAPAILAISVAAAMFGFCYARQPVLETKRWPQLDLVVPFPSPRQGALAAYAVTATLAVYAASLGILALFVWAMPSDAQGAFERGHAAVSSFWGIVALGLLAVGLGRRSRLLHTAAVVFLVLALVKALGYDLAELSPTNRSYSFLALGTLALASAFLQGLFGPAQDRQRFGNFAIDPLVPGFVLVSLGLLAAAVVELLAGRVWGMDREGLGLLALAAVFASLAAVAFGRDRDLALLFWAPAGGLSVAGSVELLNGVWLVLAWAAASSVVVWLGRRTSEDRLTLASLGYLVLALVHALAVDAPPRDLFVADVRPASGLPSLVLVTAAAYLFAYFLSDERRRDGAFWAAGTLSLYAASVGILGLFQWAALDDAESVDRAFQNAHTAVSSFWGVLGLALLYLGLRKGWREFRVAGFALFAVALAKIFLYDLSTLSPMARALSFLGVGLVLLFGAFLYQRLTGPSEESETG